ncbi:pyridine nucleotide-disulfide oxidoreductase [Kushneria pakistanensis]|uniref:Pyridine nucleotide-disulfide oxidoreductase n=1 Tax=Kushneria pakistanensis TaxID=1508770 RepID=A0ABQ3FME2_9GAMM|nr:FAD-dependent oxidoreductase [Kushneria pakistanensis]GHC29044.1 pyridine nucleotide-disulfide oxidoreductase [Kushneria pakistanensis]
MQRHDYLIIGGGMVAANAVNGIREHDGQGSIAILGAEPDGPVTRPALSKKLWTDPEFTFDQIWMAPEKDANTTLYTNTRVQSIDRDEKTVTTDDGEIHGYGQLLLATGGTPVTLDNLPEGERVLYFRTVRDYNRLRELSGQQRHIVVVGGSYIGTEIAAALVQNDTQVTLIHTEEVLGGKMFPKSLASCFHQRYLDQGVTLLGGHRVDNGRTHGDRVTLALDDGTTVEADAVVFGLGVTPNVEIAERAGLEVDDGVIVNERLQTNDENIFAAGDIARYPDQILGRQRVEHVDHANQSGTTVGHIMAGSQERYDHTPYFYSNVFDMAYKAVGTLNSSLETVEDWAIPQEKGVVYYLKDGRVKGVLQLNMEPDKLEEAREVLADTSEQSEKTLIGRIRID